MNNTTRDNYFRSGYKPFLGRIVVEALEDDTEEYMKKRMGISADSTLSTLGFTVTTEAYQAQYKCPLTRGRIIQISKNSFGERFAKWYGQDIADEGKKLKIGDIVTFIPNGSFCRDPEGKQHVVSDEQIVEYLVSEDESSQ